MKTLRPNAVLSYTIDFPEPAYVTWLVYVLTKAKNPNVRMLFLLEGE